MARSKQEVRAEIKALNTKIKDSKERVKAEREALGTLKASRDGLRKELEAVKATA